MLVFPTPLCFNRSIFVLVYVDDIIVTGSSSSHNQSFITYLSSGLSLKDLGTLSYLLGVEVQHYPLGLFLSQTKYINDILSRAKMSACKSSSTPLTATLNLTDEITLTSPFAYKSKVRAF